MNHPNHEKFNSGLADCWNSQMGQSTLSPKLEKNNAMKKFLFKHWQEIDNIFFKQLKNGSNFFTHLEKLHFLDFFRSMLNWLLALCCWFKSTIKDGCVLQGGGPFNKGARIRQTILNNKWLFNFLNELNGTNF